MRYNTVEEMYAASDRVRQFITESPKDELRATGKTTRKILEAIYRCSAGDSVLFLSGTNTTSSIYFRKALKVLESIEFGYVVDQSIRKIQFENGTALHFMPEHAAKRGEDIGYFEIVDY